MHHYFEISSVRWLLAATLSATLTGQIALEAEEARQATRLVYSICVARPTELCIDYGPAVWRASHADEVERKAEAHFRLGVGFWATLHTSTELVLAGKKVPAGTWYLGLHRSDRAQWSLTLMDAAKVRRAGLISGATRDAKPDLLVPLQLSKGLPPAPELRVQLSAVPETFGRAKLGLRWAEYQLSTQFDVDVEATAAAGEPPFAQLDPKRTTQTASGLQYEELRTGIGEAPRATSTVTVNYVGWLADGTRFDSSFDGQKPVTFPLNAVIKGWQEGVANMRPGAVFRLLIPPELAYGKAGAGPIIRPDSTLVFWIELLAVQ